MKATGMVRNIDHLGRVVLPKEIRRVLGIADGDSIEFFTDGDALILKKFNVAGDVEQMLDSFEGTLRMKELLIPATQFSALLDKVEEMKAIINTVQK